MVRENKKKKDCKRRWILQKKNGFRITIRIVAEEEFEWLYQNIYNEKNDCTRIRKMVVEDEEDQWLQNDKKK